MFKTKTKFTKQVIVSLISIFVALLILFVIFCSQVTTKIELIGDPEITIQYNEPYEELGAKGYYTTPFKKDVNGKISIKGKVNTKQVGTQTITYKISKYFKSSEVTRKIIIQDLVPPEIILETKEGYFLKEGEEYKEEGYKAIDNADGDITKKVTSERVDNTIVYHVVDAAGNETSVVRKIRMEDKVAPILQLNGNVVCYVYQGLDFNEPGFKATDETDGDISANVTVEGSVDTNKAGTYTITYNVKDNFGNPSVARRVVNVISNEGLKNDPAKGASGHKVVYLTFDDGPGPYTQKLLDILAKYNVKVTFFTTTQYGDYLDLMTKEANAGHTVAIHTYKHKYEQIYTSEAAYYDDLYKMQAVIKQYTGITTNIFRFPGGSSNGISTSYSKGIMSALSKSSAQKGLVYFDWNVSSGDAGGTEDTNQIFSNIIGGISKRDVSVVLQHDVKEYSVNAVEKIIIWGLANGYTFLPLQANSPVCHHTVNN